MIVYLLTSCSNNEKVFIHYYDTGEVLGIDSLINEEDSISFVRLFYKNGTLKMKVNMDKYGNRIGYCERFYGDGKLMFKGYFDNNGQQTIFNEGDWPIFVNREAHIDVIGNTVLLKRGQKYKIRSYVEGIEPELYILTDEKFNKLSKNEEDPEIFPYVFEPQKIGVEYIKILFPNKDGAILKSSDHFSFPISVVE